MNKINYKEFDNDITLNKENKTNINFGDIIKFLNKIIDMDKKEDRLNSISELKDSIFKLISANQKEIDLIKEDNKNLINEINLLKENDKNIILRNDNMINEINSLKENNDNLNKEIDNMKIKIEKLEYQNEEVKDILGSIQIRDLGKNFLRTFNKYLTSEDFRLINDDYFQKGQIIANRVKKTFHKFSTSKKMDVIINLILTAFDSLNEGNHYAHSIIVDNFKEDIEEYKKKKK